MATTREFSRLLSAHLGVDVVPHAAGLVRAGIVSRRDEEADAYDAAYLLLATMAAPNPDDAVSVVETMLSLPVRAIWRLHGSIPLIEPSGGWIPATEAEQGLLPNDFIDTIAVSLDEELSGPEVPAETVFRPIRIAAEQGRHSVTIRGWRVVAGNYYELEATYSDVCPTLTSMRRIAEVNCGTFSALAELLRNEPREAPFIQPKAPRPPTPDPESIDRATAALDWLCRLRRGDERK